jgi:hypothetical protein
MSLHLLIHGSTVEEIRENFNLALQDWEKQVSRPKQSNAFGLIVFLRDRYDYEEVTDMDYLPGKYNG